MKPTKHLTFEAKHIYDALHNDIRSLLLTARDKGIFAQTLFQETDAKDEQIVVTLTCQKVNTGGKPHAN